MIAHVSPVLTDGTAKLNEFGKVLPITGHIFIWMYEHYV